jgi:membrane protease subunit HflK
MDRVSIVRTDEVRRLTVGRSGIPGPGEDPGSGEFLTGDLNILRAEATVQYRIADPSAFAVRAAEVEPLLQRLAESSLARAMAGQPIDTSLRLGRALVARDAERTLATAVDRQRLGVVILGVSLTDARPPGEVAPDFAAAQAARSDRERRVNEAKSYAAASETRAHAEARARLERARGRAERTITMASGQAARFDSLQAQATKDRALTVRRMFLEALADLLPRVRRKVMLTPDEPLDLSIIDAGR